MNRELWIALAASVVAAAAICIIVLRADRRRRETQRRLSRMERTAELALKRIGEVGESVAGRQERLRDTLEERMDALDLKNGEAAEALRRELGSRLEERLRTVNEQLARVDRGLGEMKSLSEGMDRLTKTMLNPRDRGAWGETQLKALLDQLLAPDQYLENTPVAPGASERVEFALILPDSDGKRILMPVDSKFPVESYLRLREDGSTDPAFERRVLEEAKRIGSKYRRPPYTTDYCLMFLPSEGLYAEVAKRRGLTERILNEYRVLISGPSTFAALLTSLQAGYRSVRVEQKSAEVIDLLRSAREEFGRYAESVEKAEQRARQLEDALNEIGVRARAVERSLRDLG